MAETKTQVVVGFIVIHLEGSSNDGSTLFAVHRSNEEMMDHWHQFLRSVETEDRGMHELRTYQCDIGEKNFTLHSFTGVYRE